jgi:hypothetical protein
MPAPHRPERPWEPEALRIPLEAPQRRTRRPDVLDVDDEHEDPRPSGPGSHVVVIDIS